LKNIKKEKVKPYDKIRPRRVIIQTSLFEENKPTYICPSCCDKQPVYRAGVIVKCFTCGQKILF